MGNYGVIVSIDGREITIISSSHDAKHISYLAAFTSAGVRDEKVSVRVLPTQTTSSPDERLPLLLILLLAHKRGTTDLKNVIFDVPSSPLTIKSIATAAEKSISSPSHNPIRKKTYTLKCACARPSETEDSRLAVPKMIKCERCGWKFEECELGPLPKSSKSKWACTSCTSFWRVPKWGGIELNSNGDHNIYNTCSLDSFLAVLISQHRIDPSLFE